MIMKWPKYQRVISLETHVGFTSQRADTDPLTYWGWDHVPRRCKHSLLTGHTRCEPSSIFMNAEISVVNVSVSSAI
jgi:hypothetical protein